MAVYLIVMSIGLPWLGAALVSLAGDRRPYTQHTIAVLFSIAAAVATFCLWSFLGMGDAIQIDAGPGFGRYTFVTDGLGVLLASIASGVGSLTVIFSVDYMRGAGQLGRYYALVLFFIGAMTGLVLTGSLFLLFLFWELTALCSYALISFDNADPRAVSGGLKALIVTQIGGVGLLLGAVLAYSHLGTFDIRALLSQNASLPASVLLAVAYSFLIAAAAKSAQVPFHTWLPDAMEAPTPVSALIHAATMVNAGIYLLARFYPAFAAVPGWRLAVMTVGILSLLIGALQALVAEDLKRLLAYSTISQLGFLVFSVGSGAILASQFHLLSHAIFKALLFLSAGAIIQAVGTRDLRAMGGLSRALPFVRNAFIIGAAALCGLPLANGFFSKELLLDSAWERAPAWSYWLALAGTALTACYTVRAIDRVFFFGPRRVRAYHRTPDAMRLTLAILAALAVSSWLAIGPLSAALHDSLPNHSVPVEPVTALVLALGASSATYLTLAISLAGGAAWFMRAHLGPVARLQPLLRDAQATAFGFEPINAVLGAGVRYTSSLLAQTQTGLLNWNVALMTAGLLGLLGLLAAGGLR
jgi:NADH-quinone oxidoreductase subunit L